MAYRNWDNESVVLNTSDCTEKVINALGDSITYGYISSGTYADPTWCEGVASLLGCTVNNYGVSATGICDGSDESFVTRLNGMTESSVDGLLIFGGTNDYGDKLATELGSITDTPAEGTNFYAAFMYLLEQAIVKYPSAMIGVIIPLRRYSNSANTYGIRMDDIADAEIEICKEYSIPYLDLYHEGGLNPENSTLKSAYTADGLHPKQAGINTFLIPKIAEFVDRLVGYKYAT